MTCRTNVKNPTFGNGLITCESCGQRVLKRCSAVLECRFYQLFTAESVRKHQETHKAVFECHDLSSRSRIAQVLQFPKKTPAV